MDSRIPVLIVIFSILTIAVYTLSISFVSAKRDDLTMATCIISADKTNKSNCTLTVGGVSTNYDCNADALSKKWSCVKTADTSAKTASEEQRKISAADLLREMQLQTNALSPPPG
jgi:hypothetical protein